MEAKRRQKMRVIIVGGARPNFMKIAPLIREFGKKKKQCETLLVHTGQHYDFEMSEIFFQNLKISKPDIYLNIGSGSHAVQTAKIMAAFEKVVLRESPDLVVVVGDVNSTLACSLVAAKLQVKVAHVEAGLRSFDRQMPEEINRIVTDSISDYLFVSEPSGVENLNREGVDPTKVHFVGNVMIDTLLSHMSIINKSDILRRINLRRKKYCVITMHRPSNVDSKDALSEVYDIFQYINSKVKIVYPIHPRTKKMIKALNFFDKFRKLSNLQIVDPLGYIDFIKLLKESSFILTDSGGIQEETTFLGIPCLTMRENTERPITIKRGTNYLVGRDKHKIMRRLDSILKGKAKRGRHLKFWDGKAAERIVTILTTAG